MIAKTYSIIERAVEEGVQYGWNRAHKYEDTPDPETIREHVTREVMNAISEVMHFSNAELGVEE